MLVSDLSSLLCALGGLLQSRWDPSGLYNGRADAGWDPMEVVVGSLSCKVDVVRHSFGDRR